MALTKTPVATKPASAPAKTMNKRGLLNEGRKAEPASVPTPEPNAAPTANETPATYLARHEKPMLPNEQTIKEIAKARAKADASKKAPAEPTGGRYVVISGEGTMPLGADNWRRVPRGTSISVSEAELAWLERSGVAFKRA